MTRSIHLSILFLLFSVLFFSACKKGTDETLNPFDFAGQISAFGPINSSKSDKIYIDLNKDKTSELTMEVLKSSFTISPKVDGELSISDGHIVVFNPLGSLMSGEKYKVELKLKGILKDEFLSEKKNFGFEVNVIPQHASLQVVDYFVSDDTWKTKVKLKLNDVEVLETIEKAFVASQDGQPLTVSLQALSNFEYEAIVSGIDVSKSNSIMKFMLESKGMGMESSSSIDYKVPDPSSFKMINVVSENSSKISFVFSRMLKKNQNLKGLIKLDKLDNTPKYEISGNKLHLFLDAKSKTVSSIKLSKSIKSQDGINLGEDVTHIRGDFNIIPQLNNVGIGHIIPGSQNVTYPFEAIGLKSVQLEIFKVYENNLQQFYQESTPSSYYDLEFVGEVVHSEKLDLQKLSKTYFPHEISRYHFDLMDFIAMEKNALYEIRLGFTPNDVISDCASSLSYDEEIETQSIFESSYYGIFGYYEGFSWKDRENPCKKAFYNKDLYISKMILASNIGIIAKKSANGDVMVVVNDIISTQAISGASVSLFNKAQQLIVQSTTDSEGIVKVPNAEEVYLIKVEQGGDENWIRLRDNDALSMSKMDVSGRTKEGGIDGYIYGERSIWRPGDTMFLNFILFDHEQKIPSDHPISFQVEDPQGRVVAEKKGFYHNGPIYPFVVPTKRTYATGDYIVTAKIGGNTFSKFVKLENIKPNKLSIKSEIENIDISKDKKQIYANGKEYDFQVDWLYGAPAKDKKLEVELEVKKGSTKFSKFPSFQFIDPKNKWSNEYPFILAEAKTDATGKASVLLKLNDENQAPGFLTLRFKNTAYESSGDFSSNVFSVPFSPYDDYVGIELPKDEYNYERADINKEATIRFASVDKDNNKREGRKLVVNIYRMKNYWWYNQYNNDFDVSNMSSHVSKSEFNFTSNNKGLSQITTTFTSHGRYYIKVCDQASGHCSGDYLYVGYAWDDDEMSMSQYEDAAQLSLEPVKASYKVGETAEVLVPSYFEGRALVSLESGDRVVESFWTEVKRGNNKISFTTQLEMFPTIYAHVTMIQKHADKANDMPIRLYGVVPINVEDISLRLSPKIEMKSELKPKEKFDIVIKEVDKKEMYYTLAVVDEGLLNISRFKTPDPFHHFYSRPSLGVRTYDIYNDVLAAYGSQLPGLFSIGGDGEIVNADEDTRANRFKPVVTHLGPFYLEKGGKNTHRIELPNYIGAVRVMVVAGNGDAFGSAEKNIPVKQDLMVLATMPRTLSPGDRLDLPVTLFTMKDGVGNVNYGVETENNLVQFLKKEGNTSFSVAEERMERLNATVGQKEGIERVGFYAKSNAINSTQEIEIDVRNPNPITRAIEKKYLPAGEQVELVVEPIGVYKSEMSMSVSSLSPVNVQEHIDRLTRYPYGCLEQRLSASIALLYQDDLLDVNATSNQKAKHVIGDLLNNLYRFETSYGYGLWPGSQYTNEWITSYIGDFLALAKSKGYNISSSTYNNWLSYQKSFVKNWQIPNKTAASSRSAMLSNQAYRLFTLAQANQADLSEMNRLKEDYDLDLNSAMLLAYAYQKAGRDDVAKEIVKATKTMNAFDFGKYDSRTFGSVERNLAIQVLLMKDMKMDVEFADVMKSLNVRLANQKYLSTQTASFVIRALGNAVDKTGKGKVISIEYTDGASAQNLSSETGNIAVDGNLNSTRVITVKNTSQQGLYLELARRGKEKLGEESASSSKLVIKTVYLDSKSKIIDPSSLKQGTDFRMVTTITRPKLMVDSYSDLVLRQVIPSGWEIVNNRVFDFGSTDNNYLEYQDFLDNQVNSFFSLENKETIEIELIIKATYTGTFYHPKIICESMYQDDVFAERKGFEVVVE